MIRVAIKRIIPCLDVKHGRVVKGVKFKGHNDISSPVELAGQYSNDSADELAFYDIAASVEDRELFTDVLGQVTQVISIPLMVGGGINTLDDFERILGCGAHKVSVNTGALKNPQLINEAALKYGSKCVVLSVDIKQVNGAYNVFTKGGIGGEDTGLDAIEWVKRGEGLGAGELVINSMDTDGVKGGFDLKLLETICNAVSIPIIASGGAGCIDDFVELFTKLPQIDAGLAASVFHYGIIKIPQLKQVLKSNNINVK